MNVLWNKCRRHIREVGDGESQAIGMAELNAGFEAGASLTEGDRVRMSPRGRARHPKYGQREGFLSEKVLPAVGASSLMSANQSRASIRTTLRGCSSVHHRYRHAGFGPVTKMRVRSILQGTHDFNRRNRFGFKLTYVDENVLYSGLLFGFRRILCADFIVNAPPSDRCLPPGRLRTPAAI